jgi:hypothetical protein
MMNRRTFLATGATTAALAASAAAAPPETDRRGGADRLKVLVPAMTPEQIAELTAVAPQAELIVCRDGRESHAENGAKNPRRCSRHVSHPVPLPG